MANITDSFHKFVQSFSLLISVAVANSAHLHNTPEITERMGQLHNIVTAPILKVGREEFESSELARTMVEMEVNK